MCLFISALNGTSIDDNNLNMDLYRDMGKTLKKLHDGFRISHTQYVNILNIHEASSYYELEVQRQNCIYNGISSNHEFNYYYKVVSKLLEEITRGNNFPQKFVLCHNDYCNRNIIHKDDKIVGVIDFEKSIYADAICDLATMVIKKFSRESLEIFLNSYFQHKMI